MGTATSAPRPPDTKRGEDVDEYHGTSIADPYRWLEDQDGADVLAWADRQNAFTESFLGQVESRDAVRARLTELWNFERFTAPSPHGGKWVWSRNDGLQNQAVVWIADAPGDAGEVLLDPNTLSSDGTAALGGAAFSHDGGMMAFAVSEAGSDWVEWRVMEVATRRVLDERLKWSKFSGASWTHDGAGFFYQRYPAPAAGEVHQASTRDAQLCYHRAGSPQGEDQVVYERPDEPTWGFNARVTPDGLFAVVSIWTGTDRRSRVAWIDLAEPGFAVRPLLMDFDARWDFVGVLEDGFLFSTDSEAPNGRLVKVARADATERVEVVAERRERLQSARMVGGEIVATYLQDAHDVLMRFGRDGAPRGGIPLPGIGSTTTPTGQPDDPVMHFTFESFTRPSTVFAFDFAGGELKKLREPAVPFDPDAFIVEQLGFQGFDGTALKLFLVRKRGTLRLDGRNPTLLYGYGGFDISLRPSFSVENLVFVERGGIYAQATLRGGGEYGESWHAAGMRERKQTVFDDFFAAAQFLQRNDYTDRDHLAIRGRSNGGLLVGACLVQKPWLFGAAIPEVGVMDMLRYHRFTIGAAWEPEYGSSDQADMFPLLRAYSPLHNIARTVYPPTLVTTGDHDDRVLPGHSYKFAATLQAAQGGPAPILLRVTRRAGHGAGKPTALQIDEATDRLAFLEMSIGTR